MAAEAIGKSQKTKNRVATVLMVIFFTILAILIILPIYAIILARFRQCKHDTFKLRVTVYRST